MIRLVSIIRLRRRRGQAAVETMLLAFLVMLVLLGLVHFFSLTWGSQNAHLRAREAAFHGDAFLQGTRAGSQFTQPGTAPFSTSLAGPGGNYTVAPSEVVGFMFSAGATDEARDDMFGPSGGQKIKVEAVILGN